MTCYMLDRTYLTYRPRSQVNVIILITRTCGPDAVYLKNFISSMQQQSSATATDSGREFNVVATVYIH